MVLELTIAGIFAFFALAGARIAWAFFGPNSNWPFDPEKENDNG
jgi:hypothetical protein